MRAACGLLLLLLVASCKSTDRGGDSGRGGPAVPAQPDASAAPAAKACAATAECGPGERCTTEDGACDRPPGCGPEDICAQVCYGTCVAAPAAPDAAAADPMTGACTSDADCRLYSDYCTGCDCRALAKSDPDPKCSGPGVRCIADPCMRRRVACVSGKCALQASAPPK